MSDVERKPRVGEADHDVDEESSMPLSEMTATARLVVKTLEHEGPMTLQEVVASTRSHERTLRTALNELSDAGKINERTSLKDARKTVFSLQEGYDDD